MLTTEVKYDDYQDRIILLLTKKVLTVGDVVCFFRAVVEDYQDMCVNERVEKFSRKIMEADVPLEQIDLQLESEKIYDRVYEDTSVFVSNLSKCVADIVLDGINSSLISKDIAHSFLVIVDVLCETFSKNN